MVLAFAAWDKTSLIGSAIRRMIVDAPIRWLSRLTPKRVLFWAGLALAVGLMIKALGGTGAALVAQAAPETLGWIATFDVASLFDVMIVFAISSLILRLRELPPLVRSTIRVATVTLRRIVQRVRSSG